MTTLPDRSNIDAVTSTQGVIRQALGDLRDYLFESFGLVGGSPSMTSADLTNVTRLGVRTDTLGADVQIFGSVAISTTSTASVNPGTGNLVIGGHLEFPSAAGVRLRLSPGDTEIGKQSTLAYLRVNGGFSVYKGGIHSNVNYDAGGGTELFRITETECTYRFNKIWHTGNDGEGSGMNADLLDGLESHEFLRTVHPGYAGILVSTPDSLGTKMRLYSGYEFGIQPSTLYARTADYFILYKLGAHSDTQFNTGGGTELLRISGSEFTYKFNIIWHTGNDGPGSGLNADLLDGLDSTAFLRSNTSDTINGTLTVLNGSPTNNGLVVGSSSSTAHSARIFVTGYSTNLPAVRLNIQNLAHQYQIMIDADEKFKIQDMTAGVLHWSSIGANIELRRQVVINTETTAEAKVLQFNINGAWFQTINAGAFRLRHGDTAVSSPITVYNGTTGRYLITTTSVNRPGVTRVFASNNDGTNEFVDFNVKSDGTLTLEHPTRTVRVSGTPTAIGISDLSKASGSASVVNNTVYGINIYSFGDLYFSPSSGSGSGYQQIAYFGAGSTAGRRNRSEGFSGTISWNYLTGSGNPQTWVIPDDRDNIVSMWDSEDPINDFLEDEPPIEGGIQITLPEIDPILLLLEQLDKNPVLPLWLPKSKLKDLQHPNKLVRRIFKTYMDARHADRHPMTMPTEDENLVEVITQDNDAVRQLWRRQQLLRAINKVYAGVVAESLNDLIIRLFKVNRKSRTLEFK